MKHRGNSKIKYEHDMIDGLRELLESQIEPIEDIKSIILARIKRKRGDTVGTKLKIQYPTRTGLKCFFLLGKKIQEVFIVTNEPHKVKSVLEEMGL